MTSPRPADGLLDQIAEHALDDDYYVVRAGQPLGRRAGGTVLTALAVLVFAALVTVAAVQTRTDRPTTELERRTLVEDIEQRRALQVQRQQVVEDLRDTVDTLQAGVARRDPALEELRVTTADRAARGSGLEVRASGSGEENRDGRVTATDLQVIVNGLWYAGAEAVAVNGQRLGTTSSIQVVNGSITVNYRRVQAPFTVLAIGDGDALRDRFEENQAGDYWRQRVQGAGLRLDLSPSDELTVPAAPEKRVTLQHAQSLEEDTP